MGGSDAGVVLRMSPKPPQCALGRIAPTEMDTEAIKRRGWREQNILVVALHDPRLDFVTRQMVQQIGDQLYGRP